MKNLRNGYLASYPKNVHFNIYKYFLNTTDKNYSMNQEIVQSITEYIWHSQNSKFDSFHYKTFKDRGQSNNIAVGSLPSMLSTQNGHEFDPWHPMVPQVCWK